jgi:steroid delta-isomerase-like uncharacterized protein
MLEEEKNTIPQLVDAVREGSMSRRRFVNVLAVMGISAAGVSAIAAAAANAGAFRALFPPTAGHVTEHLLQQHDQHLANQTQGNTNSLQNDYAENAVVEDSMHPHPFVGRTAIMARKQVGLAAIPNLQINVTNRVVHGNQLSVEWVATGKHVGDFPGLPATGRSFAIPGVTVVVRGNDGKILRESIYYDLSDVRRQLS